MRAIKKDPPSLKWSKPKENSILLESTELAIYKRKLLLNRLFVTQSTPNETRPKTRPALKCDSVFVPIKSCISTTYLVSRPVFDGSYWVEVFSLNQAVC